MTRCAGFVKVKSFRLIYIVGSGLIFTQAYFLVFLFARILRCVPNLPTLSILRQRCPLPLARVLPSKNLLPLQNCRPVRQSEEPLFRFSGPRNREENGNNRAAGRETEYRQSISSWQPAIKVAACAAPISFKHLCLYFHIFSDHAELSELSCMPAGQSSMRPGRASR